MTSKSYLILYRVLETQQGLAEQATVSERRDSLPDVATPDVLLEKYVSLLRLTTLTSLESLTCIRAHCFSVTVSNEMRPSVGATCKS